MTGFVAGLGAVFAAALALGGAFGPLHDSDASAAGHGAADSGDAPMDGMDGGGHGGADRVRGLAVSADGLTLELADPVAAVGRTAPLRFRIVGDDGATVREFDLEHTKRMHLIVVRRDLGGFQHLHPEMAADGTWSVPLRLAAPGTYRVFADFSHDETPETLAADLQVDGPVSSRPLPPPAAVATVDGLRVELAAGAASASAGAATDLSFTVTRDGRPVELADYLGAKGHLVALREGDLAFLHVHPDEDRLRFMAAFPSAGRYRLFLQFKAAGRVHTVAFTQEVS
ncbi:MAG: hypothetical protein JSS97_04500 [Actinobacteria bacterium]|nr:hypothetical protein [Actinomycetota bacterium]